MDLTPTQIKNDHPTIVRPATLTSEYHKARRQLVLWSGILFVWELIGINIKNIKVQGVYLNQIFESPEAIPWVLGVLVLYFGFQTRLEWNLCEFEYTNRLSYREHFLSGFIIGVFAIAMLCSRSLIDLDRISLAYRFEVLTWIYWIWMFANILLTIVVGYRAFPHFREEWRYSEVTADAFGSVRKSWGFPRKKGENEELPNIEDNETSEINRRVQVSLKIFQTVFWCSWSTVSYFYIFVLGLSGYFRGVLATVGVLTFSLMIKRLLGR